MNEDTLQQIPKRFFTGLGPEVDSGRVPLSELPAPPPWRAFDPGATIDEANCRDAPEMPAFQLERGKGFVSVNQKAVGGEAIVEMVNAALVLRRPLLVTGTPGIGKSTLAYAVAHELGLGRVLYWGITSRSTLQQGLYEYDAIARLQDASFAEAAQKLETVSDQANPVVEGGQILDIGKYITLGPLGTALVPTVKRGRPRVLIVDEIDKADPDLANDLLGVLEEGEFTVKELARLPNTEAFRDCNVVPADAVESDGEGEDRVKIRRGRVRCREFPLIVFTSNDEREFPPAFMRRCLRLQIAPPNEATLRTILETRLAPYRQTSDQPEAENSQAVAAGLEVMGAPDEALERFLDLRDQKKQIMATDQLLNALFLRVTGTSSPTLEERIALRPVDDLGGTDSDSETGPEDA